MRRPPRAFVVTATALAAVLALEAAHWLRTMAHSIRASGSAYVALDDDSVPRLEVIVDEGEGAARRYERRIHDEDGDLLRTEPVLQRELGAWRPVVSPFWGTNWQHPAATLGNGKLLRTDPRDWAEDLAFRLDASQSGMAGLSRDERLALRDEYGQGWSPLTWTFEDGRFVCRGVEDCRVVAGVGPDGWREGGDAASGERFDVDRVSVAFRLGVYGPDQPPVVLADEERGALHFLRLAPLDAGAKENRVARPLRFDVTSVPVAGANGEPPRPVPGVVRDVWSQIASRTVNAVARDPAAKGRPVVVPVPVTAGLELVFVTEAGIVRRTPLRADESDIRFAGRDTFAISALPPVGGAVQRVRLRLWRDDGSLETHDVSVPAIGATARTGLAVAEVATLIRPPLLNAASFAAPRVADWEDWHRRWLLDSTVAGGFGGAWLAASLGVAVACAVAARRVAVRRLGASSPAWIATAALLGPAGLVAMLLLVPKRHRAACPCGVARPVTLSACPACASPWPSPEVTGVEVFA